MEPSHSVSPPPDRLQIGDLTADHYVVEAALGLGGMGHVYRVREVNTGRVLALKRLRNEQLEARPVLGALFEREYHALRQLAHPNIIEVYDYGRDDEGPYYTMELLDGEDLQTLAPLPVREACALLRDVASSLAILHSRRLLHRDVSPRNVRRGQDGRVKLIDFGAMATMGVSGELIGTPPCIPPEVVHGQPLDARSDLYALGALAYWALTGQHAYAAPTVAGLRDVWRSRPRPPSAKVAEVPDALDQLVMSLLSLDPLGRPVSAGEVIERLTALADLEPVDNLAIAQAYLRTPTLVGRHEQRLRFRKQVLRAGRGRGSAVLLEAAPGMGRTRMLHALELEAKLTNAVVANLDCGSVEGELGAIRVLVGELLAVLPEQAVEAARPNAELLCRGIEELRAPMGQETSGHVPLSADEGAMLDTALWQWLLELAGHRTLLISVDDAHLADAASMSVLAQLSLRASRARLALVFSLPEGVEAKALAAMSLIRRHAAVVDLPKLSEVEVQELTSSLFGDVPHVAFVGQWLGRLSEGSPRTCMELAQHLVERGIVRYEHGGWLLPESLREHALPGSLDEALEGRLETLAPDTRCLLFALSLTQRQIGLDEYAVLLGERSSIAEVSRAIDEAVTAGVLIARDEAYAFAHHGLKQAAYRVCRAQGLRETLHRRLARIFELRGDSTSRATHLLEAGNEVEALDSQLEYYAEVVRARSAGGDGLKGFMGREVLDDTLKAVRVHQRLLQVCQRLGRPQRERYPLHASITGLASHYDMSMMRGHLEPQIARLAADCGAIYMDEFADIADSQARAKRCVAKAQEVYAAASEDERVFTPEKAMSLMVGTIAHTQMYGMQSHELDVFPAIMRLADFFRGLFPRAEIVRKAALQARESVCGRVSAAAELRAELLAYYEEVARTAPTLFNEYGRGVQATYEGLYRAQYGGESAKCWADELDETVVAGEYFWKRRAWAIRRLMHLYNGDVSAAVSCRDELDQLAARHAYTPYGAGAAFYEAQAFALAGDLTGLKQVLEVLTQIVERQYPRWRPFLDVASADYNRLRGNAGAALELADGALSSVASGEHAAWAPAAVARAEALIELERFAEAAEYAASALATAERDELGPLAELALTRVLSVAEAACGAHEQAAERLERAIERATELQVEGLPLAVLYEARARVAVHAEQQDAFEHFAELTAQLYRAGKNPALVAKYERLMHQAREAKLTLSVDLAHAAEVVSALGLSDGDLGHTQFEGMDVEQRREQALSLLLEHTGAQEGFLYGVGPDGALSLLVSRSTVQPSAELEMSLKAYVQAELDDSVDVTNTCFDDDPAVLSTTTQEVAAYRPVLLSEAREGRRVVCGIAALRCEDDFITPEWKLVSTVSRVLQDEPEAQDVMSMFG